MTQHQYYDAQQRYSWQDLLLILSHGMGCTDISTFGDAGSSPIREVLV